MAHHQQFCDGLLKQITELNNRNLQLQSQLAQKEDRLAHSNRLLQNSLAASQHASVQTLQQRIADLQNQLRQAIEASATSRQRFDTIYAEQQQEVERLKTQLQIAIDNGGGGGSKHTLRNTKAELKRVKTAYASLQKQFEAEKNDPCRQQMFPASALEKLGSLGYFHEDEDDEEPLPPDIKKEQKIKTPSMQSTRTASVQFQHQRKVSGWTSFSQFPHQSSMAAPPASAMQRMAHERTSVVRKPSIASRASLGQNGKRRQSGVQQIRKPSLSQKRKRSLPEERADVFEVPDEPEDSDVQSHSSSPPCTPPSKRKRSSSEERAEAAAELEDLNIQADSPSLPSKRKRSSSIFSPQRTPQQDAIAELKKTFPFDAITDYEGEHSLSFDSQADLYNNCEELWEQILHVHEIWCESKGDEWQFEFKEDKEATMCVSTKLRIEGRETAKARWPAGCVGQYACRTCAEEKKPCFFWNGDKFQLLPLHEDDRTVRLKKGYEIRYWLNIE